MFCIHVCVYYSHLVCVRLGSDFCSVGGGDRSDDVLDCALLYMKPKNTMHYQSFDYLFIPLNYQTIGLSTNTQLRIILIIIKRTILMILCLSSDNIERYLVGYSLVSFVLFRRLDDSVLLDVICSTSESESSMRAECFSYISWDDLSCRFLNI